MENSKRVERAMVSVILVDEDANLPDEKALVHKFKNVITSDDIPTLQLQLTADADMTGIIAKHNAIRAEHTWTNDLGVDIKLKPIKLKDLTWKIS